MMARSDVFVGSSILMAAACAVTPRPVQPHAQGIAALERGGSAPLEAEADERGMKVASAPFMLQIGLRVHGSKDGPLSDGDTLVSGDRIEIFAQPTEDAHLYLAYCTAKRELTVFPEHGSIFTPAGETTVAPGKGAALNLDDQQGFEALYVILSRADLASVDPRLADAIRAAQSGQPAADCGPLFEAAVMKDATRGARANHAGLAQAWTGSSTRSWPGPSSNDSLTPRSATMRDSARGAMSSADDDERPVVAIERGMYVGQNRLADVATSADANGIAILRYGFKHVAAPRP